jgi:arylsulfatase A-like enzyme
VTLPDRFDGVIRGHHRRLAAAPMVHDILGVTLPDVYGGYEQLPVTGLSMWYPLTGGDSASREDDQYSEMTGHRAIYSDGWKAVTRHTVWVAYDDNDRELYHVAVDRSECVDLAAAEPGHLRAATRTGPVPVHPR